MKYTKIIAIIIIFFAIILTIFIVKNLNFSKKASRITIYDKNDSLVFNDYSKEFIGQNKSLDIIAGNNENGFLKYYDKYINYSEIYLTIDDKLQNRLEKSLENSINKIYINNVKEGKPGFDVEGGAAVILDVKTSEVLAMVSCGFKNNLAFENKAISKSFYPGSTFKLVTASAALNENIINEEWSYNCKGVYDYFADYRPTCIYSTKHGNQNIIQAISNSCNCFFFETSRLTGIDYIKKYAKLYGFGAKTGIDLTDEISGTIANSEQSKPFNEKDTIQAGIGQSDNSVTPLQLACYVQAIASKGTKNKPYIVKKIVDRKSGEKVFENKVITEKLNIKEDVFSTLHQGMILASNKKLENENVDIAIKTGTAQGKSGSPDALLIGFFPVENPKIAFAIAIEHGGVSTYLSEIAKDINDYYLGSKQSENN